MNQQKIKKLDLFLLVLFPVLSVITSLTIQANFLTSIILFFGIPSLLLAIKNPKIFLKTSIFSLLFSAPFTFIFDYLLVRDNAWYIPSTIFPFRLFEVVALEQFVFSFFWTYFMISIYETYFDRPSPKKGKPFISKLMFMFALTTFFLVFILISLITANSSLITIPYAYAFLGLIFGVIPLSIFWQYFPHLHLRFLKITFYFFVLALLVEYVGLKLNHWTFPGHHYLWQINYLGFPIPIEEFLFYFVLSTPGILAYYEFFDDDRK